MNSEVAAKPDLTLMARWRRRCILVLLLWATTTVLFAFTSVRGLVAYPLHVHDADAYGDAAYVMADGPATFERLRAASDLYHMDRVPRIILLNETRGAGYNFVEHRSETRAERCIDYLVLFGVPEEQISTVEVEPPVPFGSLSEARAVAAQEPGLERVVVVTSSPHTRRSRLAFRRSLSSDVEVDVYSASGPVHSAEVHSPIWVEYVKLVVYFFVA